MQYLICIIDNNHYILIIDQIKLVSTIHTHSVFYDDSGIETNNDQVTIQDSYLNRIITKYFKEFSADLNIQSIGIVVW